MIAGIYSNDRKWLEYAVSCVQNFAHSNSIDITIHVFANNKELLGYEDTPLDLIFADIRADDRTGIVTAEKAGGKWVRCQTVYVADKLEQAADVYGTEHMYFVLKEELGERLPAIFHKLLYIRQNDEHKLLFSVLKGPYVILEAGEILFFERDYRSTFIETTWGKYEIKDRLDDIMPRLPQLEFVRCHNSFIVHLAAVREMWPYHFILHDGRKISITRKYVRAVRQTFDSWIKGQMMLGELT